MKWISRSRVVLLIFALVLLIGCGGSEAIKKVEVVEQETCKDYYDIGAEYFESEAYDFAIAYLEKAVECSTGFVDAHMLLGDACFVLENYKMALQNYQMIELDLPKSAKLALMKGRCYEKLGRFSEAEEEFLKAIERSDEKLTPYCYLILMDISNKEFRNAQKYLQEAYDFAPDAAQLHVLSGDIFVGMGDRARSVKQYKTAYIHYKSAREEYRKAIDDAEWGSKATKGFEKVDARIRNIEDHIDMWYGD